MNTVNLRTWLIESDGGIEDVTKYLEGAIEADDAFVNFTNIEDITIDESDKQKYYDDFKLWLTFDDSGMN